MKNFIKIILIILSITMILSVFASCGNDETKSDANDNNKNNANADADENQNENNEPQEPIAVKGYAAKEYTNDAFHYISFYCEDQLILKMHVEEDDTYESLSPFFPTIPKKEGYNSYWETPTAVYDAKNKDIRINAVYQAK